MTAVLSLAQILAGTAFGIGLSYGLATGAHLLVREKNPNGALVVAAGFASAAVGVLIFAALELVKRGL